MRLVRTPRAAASRGGAPWAGRGDRRAPVRTTSQIGRDPSAPVEPVDVDDDVDRPSQLLAHCSERPLRSGLEDQRFESEQRVEWAVGMTGGQRSVVAGVHRLDEGEALVRTDLADDQPVGTQPQCRADEIAERHRRDPFGRRGSRFEAHDVSGAARQFARVFEHDEPFEARRPSRPSTPAGRSCPTTWRRTPPRCIGRR